MHPLLALMLAIGPVSAKGEPPPGMTIVFRGASGTPTLDDRAVADAVSIYTRDLGLQLIVRPGAPDPVSGQGLVDQLDFAREGRFRLVFWYQRRPEMLPGGDVVLYVIDNAAGQPALRALMLGRSSSSDFLRTLALKIRAVLTEAPVPQRIDEGSQPAPPPSAESPDVAPASTGPDLLVLVAYTLTLPQNLDLLRQGIAVEGALPLADRWELALEAELATQPTVAVPGAFVTLLDVPIDVGARALWAVGPTRVGLGPRVGLHVIAAHAFASDGTQGGSLQAAVGVGLESLLRVPLGPRLRAEIRARIEEVQPDLRLLVHGTQAFSAGGFEAAAAAGFQFEAP